jgi:hypothetical protein
MGLSSRRSDVWDSPLRAKKAADYALWREAVMVYLEHGGYHPRLLELRQQLMAGRVYA